LAGYPWIPGSVDKIIILIYVHVPLYFVQTWSAVMLFRFHSPNARLDV
jgi:hypothetical protein